MTNRNDHRDKFDSSSNEDVEHLLKGMSLKSPSGVLDRNIGQHCRNEQSPIATYSRSLTPAWAMLAGVAVVCLVVGFALGQIFPVGSENPSLANVPEAEISQDLADSNSSLKPSRATPKNDGSSPESNALAENETGIKSAAKSKIQLIDEGLFLLDGKMPVRKYVAVSNERIRVIDPETGQPVEMLIPVRKSFVTPSPGT